MNGKYREIKDYIECLRYILEVVSGLEIKIKDDFWFCRNFVFFLWVFMWIFRYVLEIGIFVFLGLEGLYV